MTYLYLGRYKNVFLFVALYRQYSLLSIQADSLVEPVFSVIWVVLQFLQRVCLDNA